MTFKTRTQREYERFADSLSPDDAIRFTSMIIRINLRRSTNYSIATAVFSLITVVALVFF